MKSSPAYGVGGGAGGSENGTSTRPAESLTAYSRYVTAARPTYVAVDDVLVNRTAMSTAWPSVVCTSAGETVSETISALRAATLAHGISSRASVVKYESIPMHR